MFIDIVGYEFVYPTPEVEYTINTTLNESLHVRFTVKNVYNETLPEVVGVIEFMGEVQNYTVTTDLMPGDVYQFDMKWTPVAQMEGEHPVCDQSIYPDGVQIYAHFEPENEKAFVEKQEWPLRIGALGLPITIDGYHLQDLTIGGEQVQEVTMDGTVVFKR